jgi:hypothetical protein
LATTNNYLTWWEINENGDATEIKADVTNNSIDPTVRDKIRNIKWFSWTTALGFGV